MTLNPLKWIDKAVVKIFATRYLKPIAEFLNGKKTYLGLTNLLLWFFIYVTPAVLPQYPMIAEVAMQVRLTLEALGVRLDTELLASGAGLTIVGLWHKVKKYFASKEE